MNVRVLIVLFILFLFDAYAYKGISNLIGNLHSNWKTVIKFLYWLISLGILFQLYLIASNFRVYTAENPASFRFWSGIFCVLFFTKLFFFQVNREFPRRAQFTFLRNTLFRFIFIS